MYILQGIIYVRYLMAGWEDDFSLFLQHQYKLALMSLGQTYFELRKEVQKKGAKSLGCKLQIEMNLMAK